MDVHPESRDIFCPLCPRGTRLESQKPPSMDRRMSNDALAEKGSDFFREFCARASRFTKPSPHSRAASCAQEFEREEAAVAAGRGRIIAGWHLINVVISSMGTRNGGDCDGMLAGTSANACSEEPKRTENMEKKDQSAAHRISVPRFWKFVNRNRIYGKICYLLTYIVTMHLSKIRISHLDCGNFEPVYYSNLF